jgi:1-acyl-sn-glycerol-3-phosphate acyltransferase
MNSIMGVKTGLKRAAFVAGYGYTGLSCAVGVLASVLLMLLPLPQRVRECGTRWIIHRLSAGLVGYLRAVHLLDIEFAGVPELARRRGAILALNHPTYIDAVLILSQLPDVFCLTKASIHRNPWVAAMARGAGYESNEDPSQLVEHCAMRLRRGETVLVFPEGTRTTTPPIGKLKRGFAHMAVTAPSPVLTIRVISENGPFLRKGQPFFAWPETLPLRYRFEVGDTFQSEADESSKELLKRVETYFRATL